MKRNSIYFLCLILLIISLGAFGQDCALLRREEFVSSGTFSSVEVTHDFGSNNKQINIVSGPSFKATVFVGVDELAFLSPDFLQVTFTEDSNKGTLKIAKNIAFVSASVMTLVPTSLVLGLLTLVSLRFRIPCTLEVLLIHY